MDSPFRTDTIEITPGILSLIAGIDEFKGSWKALSRIAPDRLAGLRRVATIQSVGSSTRIEGASLSDREVEGLLSNLEIRSLATRDEQEVAGYSEVMETIFAGWNSIELTENHIKQLHRDLLVYSEKDARHRGNYKTHANHVEAFGPGGESLGIVFETASPFDTPRLMSELVEWVRGRFDQAQLHPLLVTAIFIVVFLEIHPFQDGNGRLSRALTKLLLLRSGYAYVPYSSLESVIEQNKETYYLSLRRTQGTIRSDRPDWQPWIVFFVRTLDQQVQQLRSKIEHEQLLLAELPELSVKILELAGQRGRVSVSEVVKATRVSRNTIKYHLKALTKNGHLKRHGAGRGAWYSIA